MKNIKKNKELWITVRCGLCSWLKRVDFPFDFSDEKIKVEGKKILEQHLAEQHSIYTKLKLGYIS